MMEADVGGVWAEKRVGSFSPVTSSFSDTGDQHQVATEQYQLNHESSGGVYLFLRILLDV